MEPETHPLRQIRAACDDDTLTVYQAYSPAIAQPALQAGTFGLGGGRRARNGSWRCGSAGAGSRGRSRTRV